ASFRPKGLAEFISSDERAGCGSPDASPSPQSSPQIRNRFCGKAGRVSGLRALAARLIRCPVAFLVLLRLIPKPIHLLQGCLAESDSLSAQSVLDEAKTLDKASIGLPKRILGRSPREPREIDEGE